MCSASTWQSELEAYFAGGHVGDMGLKSWLGSWSDYGPVRGGQSSSAPSGPDGPALAAARSMQRVEEALALLAPTHVCVLQGFYAPRGPDAWGARQLGAIAGVALALPPRVMDVFTAEIARAESERQVRQARSLERLRASLRSESTENVRAELELVPLLVAVPVDPLAWVRGLIPGDRSSRRVLRRVLSASEVALKDAHEAYRSASEESRVHRRVERTARVRASLEGR